MANLPYFQVEVGAERQRFDMPEREGEVMVGRATDCHWIIPSGAVSRRHARVVRHGREVTIEDLGSSNGTFVNGERLSAPRALRDQDRVQLGAVEIRFVMPPEEPSADATIALQPKIARVEPPPIAPPTETKATRVPAATSGTRSGTPTVAPPPRASAAEEFAPGLPPPRPVPPPAKAAPETPRPTEASAASLAAPAQGPSGAVSGAPRAADGLAPTIAELAIIAAGSFLLVFVIGALLIRFLF
jgi:predicted component of type VI protein secretion system